MKIQNNELWMRIKAYDPDQPASDYSFSVRLARENHWTRHFTEKALLEYKKFMYLAAISDGMVSPSEIVDIVWHQHLIFTQSYNEFCKLLGKRIEHIPSTHSRDEAEKFHEARIKTKQLYEENFGEQPADCWQHSNMSASLLLGTEKIEQRLFVQLGILVLLLLIPISYFTIGQVYPMIEDDYFIMGYLVIIGLTFAGLFTYNRKRLWNWVDNLPSDSFLKNLRPGEAIYMRSQELQDIIQHELNELVKQEVVRVDEKMGIEIVQTPKIMSQEASALFSAIREFPNAPLTVIYQRLRTKIIFLNPAYAIKSFLEHFRKSERFGKLFRMNFYVIAAVWLIGVTRVVTGVVRDQPAGGLAFMMLVLLGYSIYFFFRLNKLIGHTIVGLYEEKLIKNLQRDDRSEWEFFVLGNAAIVPMLFPLIRYRNRNNPDSPGSGSCSGGSSCGSGCGSGCGGGCGGCGS